MRVVREFSIRQTFLGVVLTRLHTQRVKIKEMNTQTREYLRIANLKTISEPYTFPYNVNTVDEAADYFQNQGARLVYIAFLGPKTIHHADCPYGFAVAEIAFAFFDDVEWDKVGLWVALHSHYELKNRPDQLDVIAQMEFMCNKST